MRIKVSPFGAKYLPSQFNRLMATVLGDVDDNLFFYFDDIIGSYQTVDAMLRGLADILQQLWKANLRVNFQKSDLYLANRHFTLRTDSQGLIYLQAFKKPNAKLHTASAILDELSFDLQHQSANKKNLMDFADMISRAHDNAAPIKEQAKYKDLKNPVYDLLCAPPYMPLEPIPRPCFDSLVKPYLEYFYNEHQEEIDNKKMDDICHINPKPKAGIQLLRENEQEEEYALLLEEEQHQQKFNAALFQKAQENDPILKVVKITEQGVWVKHNRILYIRRPGIEQKEIMAIIIPQILQRPILDHYHRTFEGPHFGRKKLYMTLKRYFWWRGMARHVADYCSQCIRCKYETPKLGPKVQFQQKYKPQHPNEIISIDIVRPYPKSNLGRQYVLTIQCEFSKYVCAIPLRDKTANGVT